MVQLAKDLSINKIQLVSLRSSDVITVIFKKNNGRDAVLARMRSSLALEMPLILDFTGFKITID